MMPLSVTEKYCEGGVSSVLASPSEEDLAFITVIMNEVCLLCLLVRLKEMWPLWLSVSVGGVAFKGVRCSEGVTVPVKEMWKLWK